MTSLCGALFLTCADKVISCPPCPLHVSSSCPGAPGSRRASFPSGTSTSANSPPAMPSWAEWAEKATTEEQMGVEGTDATARGSWSALGTGRLRPCLARLQSLYVNSTPFTCVSYNGWKSYSVTLCMRSASKKGNGLPSFHVHCAPCQSHVAAQLSDGVQSLIQVP